MTTTKPKPLILHTHAIQNTASESFPDPNTGGSVSWKTLISAPRTETDSFTVGVATCAPGVRTGCRGNLKPHRHKQAEVYHVTQGKGLVTVEGEEYVVEKGSVVWIPGDAEHGVENVGEEDFVWLYVFAVDGFADVVYRFDEPGVVKRDRAKL